MIVVTWVVSYIKDGIPCTTSLGDSVFTASKLETYKSYFHNHIFSALTIAKVSIDLKDGFPLIECHYTGYHEQKKVRELNPKKVVA